jgi:hypothetical protein
VEAEEALYFFFFFFSAVVVHAHTYPSSQGTPLLPFFSSVLSRPLSSSVAFVLFGLIDSLTEEEENLEM